MVVFALTAGKSPGEAAKADVAAVKATAGSIEDANKAAGEAAAATQPGRHPVAGAPP